MYSNCFRREKNAIFLPPITACVVDMRINNLDRCSLQNCFHLNQPCINVFRHNNRLQSKNRFYRLYDSVNPSTVMSDKKK